MESMWLLKLRPESDYSQTSVQSGILSTEEGLFCCPCHMHLTGRLCFYFDQYRTGAAADVLLLLQTTIPSDACVCVYILLFLLRVRDLTNA